MTDRESTLLAGRVKRIEQILGTSLHDRMRPSSPPLPKKDRDFLNETAQDLYWNELEWEKITNEERLDEEFLTELAFPGFLAFVRGLLLDEVMPDSQADPSPSPEVVEDLLEFLAQRVVELEEGSSAAEEDDQVQRAAELKMTSRLLDLVLYIQHDLGSDEIGKIEATLSGNAADP